MKDTVKDWIEISRTQPYWGVLTADEYRTERLSPGALRQFYAGGEQYVSELWDQIEHHFGHFRPARALDFGCGVGRLLAPIAKRCAYAIGVDVAPEMCEISAAYLRSVEIQSFQVSTDLPEDRVDWVNSYIVFQHIPPQIGYDIIHRLWALLNARGIFSVHVAIFRERGTFHTVTEATNCAMYDGENLRILEEGCANTGIVSMFDYDLNRVLAIIANHAGEIHLRHENHSGHHSVNILAQKAPV